MIHKHGVHFLLVTLFFWSSLTCIYGTETTPKKATHWLEDNWVSFSLIGNTNLGKFRDYIPFSNGMTLGYQHNPELLLSKFNLTKNIWIPNLLFEIGYGHYKSLPYQINSFSASPGALWLFKPVERMPGFIRVAGLVGYSYLDIKAFSGEEIVVDNHSHTSFFQIKSGYEYSLNHIKMLFDMGFGLIYDKDIPIYQIKYYIGIGYRLK